MSGDLEGASTAPDDDTARDVASAWEVVPWLLRHKVALPDPVEGWLEREELEARCVLTERRLTVLHAPGGFGKTALLGQCCRALRERGVAVAWLSLDEDDGPGSLAVYLALAFEEAGLGTFGEGVGSEAGALAQAPGPQADTQVDYRINLLVRALERHGAPCVLTLDEVERLASPGAVGTLNALLRRAPGNLHLGMAFREPPPGLEIAMFALEGREATMTADDLRFSRSDIARFFAQGLSRREVTSVAADSAGWPIALRIHRNAGRRESGRAQGAERTVAGWIETRLWRGIADEDRDFVLDAALFDSLDPALLDEVLGVRSAGRRIASMGALAGLLSTRGGGGAAMRLHPLIRDWCERRRFEETPNRFRAIHRDIARALARRGRFVEALRHAGEAGDAALLGEVGERTGGVRLWLEQGVEGLRAVDGLLSEEVLGTHPRLALVRCVALTLSGDIAGARRVYGAAEAATAGFTRDREGGDDGALLFDHLLVYGLVEMCGCVPYGELSTQMLPLGMGVVEGRDPGVLFRGVFSLGLCFAHNQGAGFDAAVEWGERAREALGRDSPYLAHVDFQLGSVAMARGRAEEALACYGRALRVARASHLRDAGAMALGEVLAAELAFERSAGAVSVDGTRLSPRLLGECGAWLDIYAASAEVGAELARLDGGVQAALVLVEDAREHARRTGRAPLERFLSALRVSVLLAGGGPRRRSGRGASTGCPKEHPSASTSRRRAGARRRCSPARGFGCSPRAARSTRPVSSPGRSMRWRRSASSCARGCGASRSRWRSSTGPETTPARACTWPSVSGCTTRPATPGRSRARARSPSRSSTALRRSPRPSPGRRPGCARIGATRPGRGRPKRRSATASSRCWRSWSGTGTRRSRRR